MSNTIATCYKDKWLDKVSAGEVCSLDVAMSTGILGNTLNNEYYIDGYSTLKTFNSNIDTSAKVSALCDVSADKSSAYAICPLELGLGFTATSKNKCMTSECPTSFTEYKDAKGNVDDTKCVKPSIEQTALLRNKIDERWHDWFSIPEYHLGNKYAKVNDANYAPCAKGFVPNYSNDPVDGAKSSYMISENTTDTSNRCISKDKYFAGKYKESPSYCPTAWIMRAGATKEDLSKMYKKLIDDLPHKDDPTQDPTALTLLKADIDRYVTEEIYKPIQNDGFSESAYNIMSEEDSYACSTLNTDIAHLEVPYDICTTLKNIGQEKFVQNIMDKNKDTDKNVATIKYLRAKQACHSVFCNTKGDSPLSKLGGATAICFPEVEQENIETRIKVTEAERVKIDALPEINSNKGRDLLLNTILKWPVLMIVMTFVLIGLYVLWKELYYVIFGGNAEGDALRAKLAVQLRKELGSNNVPPLIR